MTLDAAACPSGDERVVLFGLLAETNARLSRDLATALEAECGLPLAWFDVLLRLRRSEDGRLKMSQMADAIVHSTGGTTRLVDRLEEAGLVVRQNCPNDRRAVYVAITPAGNARLDGALAVHVAFLDRQLAARLSGDERTALRGLLAKLGGPSAP
ncbi:MAG TPA: MarR family transcriptional regulator [Acidimicrobiales bacterium]|nr:MarR family transcriptional regulator [Acidimicrobiales bacterium]